MPISQGFVRLRKHQMTRQAVQGTVAPATRAYPATGTPSVDLAWTDTEVDEGSRDPIAPPYRGPGEYTADLTYPAIGYNTLTKILCGFFGGGETPTGGGTAKTWTHEPASLTVDDPDLFSYEFGDDVVEDWYQFGDGIIEQFEITGPEGLGPLEASANWRFGSVASTGSTDFPVTGTVPTPGLSVDPNEVKIYLKDGGIYIGDTVAGVAAGQITDALHTFVFRGTQEVDLKRYANGDQSFDIDAYGPGKRELELECTFAKTDQTVGVGSESDDWMSDQAVNRFIRLHFISTAAAQTPSTWYSWQVTMPMRYYTREEGEIGGNTTVVLTAHAYYDPEDFDKVLESILVNTLTEAELGAVGS